MDIKLSNVTYDKSNKQTLCGIGGMQLTLPDQMRISDIEYFINDKLFKAFQDSINMVAARNEAQGETPFEKAKRHYKDLGW